MKLLLIEDELSLHELITGALGKEGHIVESAYNCASALDKLSAYYYDCILLDINLPDGSGLTILEHLKRSSSKANIIIISARDSLDDKVQGLELGADDYLAKPFHISELSARIRSVVRRSQNAGNMTWSAGNVSIEDVTNRLFIGGKEVSLLKKEFDILKYFIMRPGHVVDKSVLAEAIWGDHIDQSDDFQFVYAQMKNLRKKLTEAGADIEIKSVYGFGYKLILP
ncbi:MAG: response regulator transcription factor [Bacteroidaceae bacterium]|nr:response regulator transcription factor [Bacteroidaceae bacterium]